mmetsp:Transcript_103981/g.279316  ORF Transcript_103981/g.279316 Transcript_103981/m.279316 type:complete len:384 (+) Transcript_103981:70-1221(+)
MALKRTAQSPKGKAGRLAKFAKSAPPCPVDAKYAAAFDLLAELSSEMPPSCIDMLTSVLPHALETFKEHRHGLKESVLTSLGEVCNKEQAKRETRIAVGEAKISALELEKAGASEKLDAAKASEAALCAQKQAAEACVASAVGAVDAAAAGLAQAKQVAADAEANAEGLAKEKEEFDAKVQELFPPLKDGTWAKKDWRQRQKAIAQFMGLFAKTRAPESLKVSLPLALKDVPDARGAFARKTVEEGGKALKEHSAELEQAIDASKLKVAERLEDVSSAAALANEASESCDAAQEDYITKGNQWLEAEEALASINKLMVNFLEEGKRLVLEVEAAKTALQVLLSAIEKFKLLADTPVAELVVDNIATLTEASLIVEACVSEVSL